MTAELMLDNLVQWSAQAGLLVAVGAAAAMTLSHPRARLIFWQGVLAIALLLPVVEPWHRPPAAEDGVIAITADSAPVVVNHPAAHLHWKREYLLLILAAGALLRLLWIGAGLVRLRMHVLDARMLAAPPVPFANPRVRWFLSNTIGGPVTFGFLSPTILLPARIAELPVDLREAIAHHELAHVRRRDWLFVLAEESIRSVLWFHPAIWYVLSRIQLAREQVVDAEVVGLTRDRDRYLDALVAIAAQRLLPDVAPAPLFLKKRQLAVRVAAVLKENRMSKPRMFLSFASVCSAAMVAARLAVWMFPMQAPAQTVMHDNAAAVADGPGVAVETGAKILHRSPVFYPAGTAVAGTVIIESTVNAKGEVTDAHVVSGPDELRRAALASVLTWHFSPVGLPPTVESVIRFEPGAPAAARSTIHAEEPAARTTSNLKAINLIGLSDELAEKVRVSLPVRAGDTLGTEQMDQVRTALTDVDEHLMASFRSDHGGTALFVTLKGAGVTGVTGGVRGGVGGGVIGGIVGGVPEGAGVAMAVIPDLAEQLPPAEEGVQRVRVGGMLQSTNLIKKIAPAYPPLAKQARVQGTVRFTALINSEGQLAALQLVEGHPLLVESAREAVSQWQYKPTLLNGRPVEVITQIDVNYTLSQ